MLVGLFKQLKYSVDVNVWNSKAPSKGRKVSLRCPSALSLDKKKLFNTRGVGLCKYKYGSPILQCNVLIFFNFKQWRKLFPNLKGSNVIRTICHQSKKNVAGGNS